MTDSECYITPKLNSSLSCTNTYSIFTSNNSDDYNHDLTTSTPLTSTLSKNIPILSNRIHKVKITILNFKSIKMVLFHAPIDILKADNVLGFESNVTNSMCMYESFPKKYTALCKDRNVNGDVFFATND